ncbi:MAG: geranylgeranylglycerol-phosphate geranylgeranyltransferase [Vulcanisaeta sp.]|nr:geranylgeranylglycerol-phosphate geranylgeranyltransferase [Vulcanisaeta sp.]MCG2894721.1 geranylgeranylglycerol-phosphate geranylgeranyltransferase [Vulcanisaeta sp.]
MNLRALARLSRIEHGVLTSLIVIASYVVSGGRDGIAMAILFTSSLLTEVFLFVTNDIYNIEEDRINRPDAPLVRGEVSIGTAWALSLVSLTTSVLLNIVGVILRYLALWSVIILIIAIALGFSYNYRLKKVMVVNNLLVSITSSLTFLYGLYAVKSTPPTINLPYMLFTVSLLATMGRELIKGILDIPGDIRAGVQTIANRYGVSTAIGLAVVFTLIAVALSPLIIILSLGEAFGFVLAVGVVITDALLTYISINVLRRHDYAGKFRSLSLLAMSITIITYLLLALLLLIFDSS